MADDEVEHAVDQVAAPVMGLEPERAGALQARTGAGRIAGPAGGLDRVDFGDVGGPASVNVEGSPASPASSAPNRASPAAISASSTPSATRVSLI